MQLKKSGMRLTLAQAWLIISANLNMGEGAILTNSMAEEINQENRIDDQSNPGVGCTTLGRKMPKAI